ncbi:hypothetical protein N7492_003623 [Penicillium capsulatum]|uniref:G-patch domain-containing protein n=1 Tax=Penicillium capsulatum TaxID=69766 RepID=A0A9W9LWD8_9EURO|nr:hypothetical protein N7492_003623 [Penicillium capsulatum]KAJ6121795.1 hypothetical protein N7512_004260 [Penicillium capsulatum]
MSSDEEDYMSMVIEEPKQKETFTQRKRREQREAEDRARVPSKAERAARDAARRDEALATSTLDPSNKGFKMMAKLGFKAGDSLGKRDPDPNPANPDAPTRAEPLNLIFKEDRGGIGLDNEKKRKIREEAEEAAKKVKREEGDYRDRVREERELRRTEAQIRAAQKVAERLDTEADETGRKEGDQQGPRDGADGISGAGEDEIPMGPNQKDSTGTRQPVKPTAQINVLYRGIVREREDRERDIQARHALQSSLPSSFFPTLRLPEYEDGDLDRDDKHALGPQREPFTATVEQELEEEDPELDAFNALEPAERLHKLVLYLRETYRYCFWCKYRYETAEELEGCPGLTEEDHD